MNPARAFPETLRRRSGTVHRTIFTSVNRSTHRSQFVIRQPYGWHIWEFCPSQSCNLAPHRVVCPRPLSPPQLYAGVQHQQLAARPQLHCAAGRYQYRPWWYCLRCRPVLRQYVHSDRVTWTCLSATSLHGRLCNYLHALLHVFSTRHSGCHDFARRVQWSRFAKGRPRVLSLVRVAVLVRNSCRVSCFSGSRAANIEEYPDAGPPNTAVSQSRRLRGY